jgi:preprotein translocase subunit SecG
MLKYYSVYKREVFIVQTLFTILHILISLFVIVVVMAQPAKVQGLSSAISGGAQTFFGKNKARTYEGKLQKATTIAMILFVITSLALGYFANK